MLSPFSILKKVNSKFKSLDVWNQLKKRGDDLSWYFAVSTNRMPAKYLISKSIFCNIQDLAAPTEERLWEEHEILTEIFLKTWKEVRSEKHDVIRNSDCGKTSLMDLNIELTKRMLKHCNFCLGIVKLIDPSSQAAPDLKKQRNMELVS